MLPAENEFRGEKFSRLELTHFIKTNPEDSKEIIDRKAKQHALKTVLEQNGLKSVTTQNKDTIISYEGVIKTPVLITLSASETQKGEVRYTARLQFAPLAFPDQWEFRQKNAVIKNKLHDFLRLFE